MEAIPLRVLVVEDSESDTALVIRLLEQDGYATTHLRVETAEDMAAALRDGAWDIVLSDYSMPRFDAPRALEVLQASRLDVPFIVVSGSIGEDIAVQMMKAGASDYVMKDKPARLVQAVVRELREAEERRQHRLAEEELVISEQKYRRLAESTRVIPWEADADSESFSYIGRYIEDLLGYPHLSWLEPGAFAQRLHPDDRERVLAEAYAANARGADYTNEFRMVAADGRIIWLRCIVTLFKESGKSLKALGHAFDITDIKQMEASLRKSEESLRNVIESTTDAMIAIDQNGLIVIFNPAAERIFRYSAAEILNQTPDILMPELNRADHKLIVSSYFSTGLPNSAIGAVVELTGLRRDGTEIPIELALSRGAHDAPAQVLAVIRDITDRKRAETALKRINRALKALSASNLALIYANSEQSLLDEVCSIFVGVGGYQLAWIGFARHDAEKSVEIVAAQGSALDYTKQLRVTWGEDANGIGPVGAAIKTRQIAIIEDSQTDPRFGVWRQAAATFGLRTSIAVPLIISAEDIGVLILYAQELGVFTAEETELLSQLAKDLAFGITTIREREQNHRTQQQLDRTQRSQQALLDSIPDMAWLKDEQSSFISVNQTFAQNLGRLAADISGKSDYDFYPRELADAYRADDQLVISKGQPKRVEEPYIGSDGIEKWIETIKVPFRNNAGQVIGTAGIARDITERKLAEQQRLLLHTAIEQTNEAIVITDSVGIIQYANPAFEQISGYQVAEAVGLNVNLMKSGKQSAEYYQQLWETILAGQVWKGRLTNRRKSGELYQEELTITPVLDSAKSITSFVAVKRDISEQILRENELRQAQKLEAIGQLAAGMAHEINTPMQYISGNTIFLRDSLDALLKYAAMFEPLMEQVHSKNADSAAIAQAVATAREIDIGYLISEIPQAFDQTLEGIGRVIKIVRAMREFSHPGTDERSLIDLNKAIQSTITIARNEWKYVADVQTDLDAQLPPLNCFSGEISQVVLNLLTNAAQAIAEVIKDQPDGKGLITVSTRLIGDNIELRVGDTGAGIPEAIRDRIFEPFFTTKEIGKGTGQGLAISRATIVVRHGGSIAFETELGQGTTFIILLPLQSEIRSL
jgi:PAS domain S-box-containing protein